MEDVPLLQEVSSVSEASSNPGRTRVRICRLGEIDCDANMRLQKRTDGLEENRDWSPWLRAEPSVRGAKARRR